MGDAWVERVDGGPSRDRTAENTCALSPPPSGATPTPLNFVAPPSRHRHPQGPATLAHSLLAPHFGGISAGHLATPAEAAYPLCAPADFAWPYGDKTKLSLCVLEALRINPAVYETVYTCIG